MSQNKIKKEYLIIGIVIVLMLAYLLLRNPDKMHYTLPQLKVLPQAEITKVEIIKSKETITLTSKDKKWFIAPLSFPADQTKVEKILKVITSMTLTDLRSTEKNYSLFGLGKDDGITVKAYKENQLLREFSVGKAADTYRHTFVKLAGDNNVYAARTSFKSDFDSKMDDLRDKQVMKFDKNEISEFRISKGDVSLQLAKKVTPVKPAPTKDGKEGEKKAAAPAPQPEISWVLADGTVAKKSELDNILNQLSNLSCDGYLQGKKKEDLKNPIYTISLKGSKDYEILFYEKVDQNGEKYPAVCSESPYPFLLSTYTANNLMKKPGDLKEEVKADKVPEKK